MLNGLFSSLWWVAGGGLFVAGFAAFFVFYLGRKLTQRLIYIGLGVVIVFGIIGYSRALIDQGRKESAKIYDGAIDKKAQTNRDKENLITGAVDGRTEQLGVKVKRIRQKGIDERDWIAAQEKPDGRIDPQTIETLER